ncbi:cytochrome c3 family protein [uncultured Marixanthomonas sp.]|uniref:cytochrome c3 family protein n=1 Tax=uncultured Marixanthomonas sp. TaxID=757245 RepID=UPI0030D74E30|tara:strand:- start:80332 stop:81666 length:1335 start_codon:yes stop_codon:yes gene_type:complete
MKKVNYRNLSSCLSFLLLALLLTVSTTVSAQDESAADTTAAASSEAASAEGSGGDVAAGENLFKANCAACHKLDRKATGPALRGVADKYDRDWLYEWIKDSQAMIKSGDPQAVKLFEEHNNSVMTAFPQLSNGDIDNILAYTSAPKPEPTVAQTPTNGGGEGGSGVSNNIVLGALALVFLLLVVMLFLVTNTLKKIAAANGVVYPEKEARTPIWKAFVQNQFLVLVTSVFLLLTAGYFMYGFMMQVGVDQGYAPVQPIHFSHKIHAGDNQVDCNFCHSSARKSKTSGIPSLNVCMNCHKNIAEVAPETATEEYSKEFYDAEIQKLYDAVGWNVDEQAYTGEEKPVKWVRIHNLPDFAYFNHSQHVTVAGIACQECHGPVEEFEIMEQHSPLTMGWCINCHRDTNVRMEGNEYYEKIHEQLAKKYGVEKVTAAQMGGLECGKCHY